MAESPPKMRTMELADMLPPQTPRPLCRNLLGEFVAVLAQGREEGGVAISAALFLLLYWYAWLGTSKALRAQCDQEGDESCSARTVVTALALSQTWFIVLVLLIAALVFVSLDSCVTHVLLDLKPVPAVGVVKPPWFVTPAAAYVTTRRALGWIVTSPVLPVLLLATIATVLFAAGAFAAFPKDREGRSDALRAVLVFNLTLVACCTLALALFPRH